MNLLEDLVMIVCVAKVITTYCIVLKSSVLEIIMVPVRKRAVQRAYSSVVVHCIGNMNRVRDI